MYDFATIQVNEDMKKVLFYKAKTPNQKSSTILIFTYKMNVVITL